MDFYIFVPKRKGHYNDYATFLESLLDGHNVYIVKENGDKRKALFSNKKNRIIFLDVDFKDFGWIMMRSIISRHNFGVSVALETVIDRDLRKLFNKNGKLQRLMGFLKYHIYYILKKLNRLKIISNYKGTASEKDVKKIVSLFSYEIMYYDLPYMRMSLQKPPELDEAFDAGGRPVVLVINNTINTKTAAKKNLDKLGEFIARTKKYHFLLVGNTSYLKDSDSGNYTKIPRFISNEEMFYLLSTSDVIYCYYSNNRPSGFMGRAMQLNRFVIVPKDSYSATLNYSKSLKVDDLSELDQIDLSSFGQQGFGVQQFNEAAMVKKYLESE